MSGVTGLNWERVKVTFDGAFPAGQDESFPVGENVV